MKVIKFLISSVVLWIGSVTFAWSASVSAPKYFIWLSQQTGVPPLVLYALSVQETNTKMVDGTVSPWPYTINHKRKAFFYATEAEMLSKARSLISQGYHSFDVGPFQVNWKWNGHRARSIEDLGNVHRNGIIAAEILMEHYKKYGNWIDAAGRYHNPANKNGLADKYKKEFREKLAMIESGKYQRLAQKNE